MTGASTSYEQAGVNLEAGDAASDTAYELSQASWQEREGTFGKPEDLGNHFRGIRVVSLSPLTEIKQKYPDFDPVTYTSTDGAGNKGKVAQRMQDHRTIGIDLVAMATDDAAATGAEVVGISDTVIVNTLGKKDDHPNKQARLKLWYGQLMSGIVNGSIQAGAALQSGETAEHGEGVDGYGEFRYELAATATWVADRRRLLTVDKIEKDASVVAIAEPESLGCNGYSLLLKQLEQVYGYEWHHEKFGEESTWGAELLKPTTIYAKLFAELTGGFHPERQPAADVQAIVHVTGGGIFGKLASKLNGTGLGAELNHLFNPTAAMLAFQRLTGISDEEMYHVFHMGQRALILTSTPESVISVASSHGKTAKVAGRIIGEQIIGIESRGTNKDLLSLPLVA